MAGERLVAVSYPVDQEYTKANFEILGDDAEIVRTYELDAAGRARALRDADALLAWDLAEEIPAGALQRAGRLRFVQLLSAGVDAVDFTALPERLTVACDVGARPGVDAEPGQAPAAAACCPRRRPVRQMAARAGPGRLGLRHPRLRWRRRRHGAADEGVRRPDPRGEPHRADQRNGRVRGHPGGSGPGARRGGRARRLAAADAGHAGAARQA